MRGPVEGARPLLPAGVGADLADPLLPDEHEVPSLRPAEDRAFSLQQQHQSNVVLRQYVAKLRVNNAGIKPSTTHFPQKSQYIFFAGRGAPPPLSTHTLVRSC